MRSPWLAAWFVAAVGACTGDTSTAPDAGGTDAQPIDLDGGVHDPDCIQVCNLVAPLACPRRDQCLPQCDYEAMASCKKATHAWIECVKTRTVMDFTCGPTGDAQAKPGVCPDELAALMRCVFSGHDLP